MLLIKNETDTDAGKSSPDPNGPYILYAIRHRPSGRLLKLLASTKMTAEVEEGENTSLFRLQIDRSMHVANQAGGNPVFICQDKVMVENLLHLGYAQDGPNRMLRDALAEDLELVTLSAMVVEDVPPEAPLTVEQEPKRPWWRRRRG